MGYPLIEPAPLRVRHNDCRPRVPAAQQAVPRHEGQPARKHAEEQVAAAEEFTADAEKELLEARRVEVAQWREAEIERIEAEMIRNEIAKRLKPDAAD